MPKVPVRPLTDQDLDALQAIAAKANVIFQRIGCAPLYVALDVGDQAQRDAYLFLSWPALNSRGAHCARLIFDYIGDVAKAEFGATMVATTPQGAPDGSKR